MEISVPEKVSQLYAGNEEINKIYELLNSGQPLQKLLRAGTSEEISRGDVIDAPQNLKEGLPQSTELDDASSHRGVSDCIVEINQPPASDLPYAHVAGTRHPGFRRRLLAVLSVLVLLVVTASGSFYVGHLANRPSEPTAAAQVPVTRERSPAVDLKSANSSETSVAAATPPPHAGSPILSPPDPGSTADTPALASPDETISTAAPKPPLTATTISSQPMTQPLPAEEVANILAHGDALLVAGDVTSARLFYERAADGGDAGAALRLGETYDPAFLMRVGLTGLRGDIAEAQRWYRRAVELGAPEAKLMLENSEDK